MVFDLTNARDYKKKVEADLDEFLNAIADPYKAINACTSTFHLYEWLWAHNLKPMNPPTVRGKIFRQREDFLQWLDQNCPYFPLVQQLANGSKHATPVHSSRKVAGYGEGPYGIGPYDSTYLLVDLEEGSGLDRYKVASVIIKEAADFMLDLAEELLA